MGLLFCREDKIRTCDPLHPIQVRYRAAPLPELLVLRNFWCHFNNIIPVNRGANIGRKQKIRLYCTKFYNRYMKILLRQVGIADPASAFNGLVKDILVDGSQIIRVADSIPEQGDEKIIDGKGLLVSPGWVDVFSHFCDPGLEHRETLQSGAAAAAAGGFTRVFVIPDTKPVVDNKSTVEYIVRTSAQLPADIHPVGAVTKKAEGKDLAELYDMRNSGAVAFSDGLHTVQSAGLFLKALQYVKAFDGVLIQVPVDSSINSGGLVNEGIISTRLGLPGLPAIAEEIMIRRDLDLLRYTGSKLHLTGVSTQKGIELIAEARKEGLQITCSVTPYHLFFCDEDIQSYDTNLKVSPPLRSRADMMALREAVAAGLVDCIASHHLPQDWDAKTCEFEYAKPGMIGLQTVFAAINEILPELGNDKLVKLLSNNARNIFALPQLQLAEGQTAELTLFSRNDETVLSKETNRSQSANSPFMGHKLKGKVLGIIHKGQLTLN